VKIFTEDSEFHTSIFRKLIFTEDNT